VAGHSKWNNIRIKKGRVDAKRGKRFTKLSREILVAGQGGADPESNFRLKIAISRAKKENLPSANIDRLLKKLAGADGDNSIEEITYEGYGPGGVAILVEAATDNRNRTAAEVRLAFNKNGGGLGETGCVSWSFDQRGKLLISKSITTEDNLFLVATEVGALDVGEEEETDFFYVLTERAELHQVRTGLAAADIEVDDAMFVQIPQNTIAVPTEETINCLKLTEALEDCDDVQQVFSNIELTDEMMTDIEDKL
jgi:YebC/PmpR family DNA-binding regulatory protein